MNAPARCLASALFLASCLVVPGAALAQDIDRGAELWATLECSSCHGDAAGGGMGPALAHTSLSIERVRTQVRTGGGMMPDFGEDEVSEADLTHVYAWLRSLDAPTLAAKETWWGTDLVNLPAPPTPAAGEFEVHFSHRFSESIADAGRKRLWGLDSFAFPAVWFSYGASERIAPYFGRSANLATWELGAKAEILREGDLGVPLAVGVQAGMTFLDVDGIENDTRLTVELPIGYRVSDRLAVVAVPFWVTNPDEEDRTASADWSTALGLGASFRLSRTLSLDGEWITNLGGFERPGAIDQWQAGVTMHVGGHLFQILLANNVNTTPDFMATGALSTGIDSDIRFGFNLIRSFSF